LAHDVFISHSSKDKPIADAVCARLESRGIRCWIAPRDVEPGRPYGEAIIDAIHNCRIMVLLLSSSANSSIHIAKEVERAVSHGATVIPLRIEAVMPAKSLDYFIGSVHWLDALTPPLEQHLDNLAEAILRILQVPRQPEIPVGGKISSPQQPTIAPIPTTTPAASTTSLPGTHPKKKWLIPAIVGGGALLLVAAVAVVAVLLSGHGAESARNSTTNVGASNNPGGFVAAKNPGSGPLSDPLVGCWQWFNNSAAVVRGDGLLTDGPFTAHWRLVDPARHIYTVTWPEAVDTTTLSADGRTLKGGNQYGFQMSATRLTGGPGLAGTWQWFNGAVVAIQPDGSFFVGNLRGHWRGSGLSYSLIWPKPVDTLTMSADHTHVDGANQFGIHVSGTKSGSCGS
jgi:hypothetical protein